MSDTDSSTSSLDRIAHLKAECLREASNVTALKGRRLVVVLRRSSENEGEYYCALRGQSDGRYLKLWMEKHKTYPSHVEALEAYLRFVRRMRNGCSLFGAVPQGGRRG
ncbi:hypothetical protein EKO04_010196 [Ascochyta lentis]|uniref:Uncharacterized protein n=1 Tax=Ascochyta lentis TaxID=205686 RepID=A0A8H7IVA9_9PLEO|nr:hypothetical protein EKO04_010196 [Ascochyta lentis]